MIKRSRWSGVEIVKEKQSFEELLTEKERKRGEIIEEKQKGHEFQVAFCGHFSAGKSTILNHLLGAEMLPTSPIPTSANIIGIKNGDLGLTINMVNGEKKKWTGEIPWERVREWGMNGGEIESILIEAPLPFLGAESVIYDTPGVDSTDPSHQAVTLEALYTTDFIVYVMDYNHVQSETNLNFLKQLSDEKKPLYLIVNQIDKHDERELSIKDFDQSIRNTFSEWGINILELRYTSMKAQDHRLSEVAQFEREIKAMLYHGHELLPYAKQRLQQGYYLSIVNRLNEDKEDAIEQIKEEVQAKGYELQQLEHFEEVNEAYEHIVHAKKRFEEQMEAKIEAIMKDVTVFPYTTTELAREWLESMEPNFKVGMLFAKKKTEEERERRLGRLVEEANDKVKSQLVFHLYRLFQQHDLTLLTNREEIETELSQLQLNLDGAFFKEAVQAGPKSREYVYTFTKDRTASIKSGLRRKAHLLMTKMSQGMEAYWQQEKERVKLEVAELEVLHSYSDQIKKIEESYADLMAKFAQKAEYFQDAGGYERVITEKMKNEIPQFEKSASLTAITLPQETVIDTDWEDDHQKSTPAFDEATAKEWVGQLTDVLNNYQHDERMLEERQALVKRTKNFTEQTFTISLFGAFSAGKSSFANALLGDHILPVSPHPTTATVNIVKKSDDKHRSRTATVQVKTKEQLNKEIETVAKQLDLQLSLDTLSTWKPTTTSVATMWQKTYQAYLLTLKNSLKETKWELGSEFDIELEQLQPFVANEHDACLINQVTLYYDCPLTEKGIILIDTPGVNSIHGRHTNVAFKQLRDSDAIFYLSYYNHAFSKADQTFLQQMAKVNEGFRTDKLYFILNAADLASSQFELNGVRKHVYDQLVHCGINQPRLYPLSSKKGLEGKQRGEVVDPLFAKFEAAFYEQTIAELERLSFELLTDEVKQYEKMLAEGVDYVLGEADKKEERRQTLAASIAEKITYVNDLKPVSAQQQATQEVSELFLYLRERIRYVLGDQYQDAVNVTTVVGSNKRAQQQALLHALQEWRSEGEHFLQQEIQATFVRIELALYEAISEWMDEVVKTLREQFPALAHSFEVEKKELILDIPNRLLPLELEEFASTFQSLKSFFEQQQSRKLKDDLVEQGAGAAGQQLKEVEAHTKVQLESNFKHMLTEAKRSLTKSLERELERFDLLMDPKHHEALKQEYKDIKTLIRN